MPKLLLETYQKDWKCFYFYSPLSTSINPNLKFITDSLHALEKTNLCPHTDACLQLHNGCPLSIIQSCKISVDNTWLPNFPFILWKYQLQKCNTSGCSITVKLSIRHWKTSALTSIQLPIFSFSDFICR